LGSGPAKRVEKYFLIALKLSGEGSILPDRSTFTLPGYRGSSSVLTAEKEGFHHD
jgi:hypothetical protein